MQASVAPRALQATPSKHLPNSLPDQCADCSPPCATIHTHLSHGRFRGTMLELLVAEITLHLDRPDLPAPPPLLPHSHHLNSAGGKAQVLRQVEAFEGAATGEGGRLQRGSRGSPLSPADTSGVHRQPAWKDESAATGVQNTSNVPVVEEVGPAASGCEFGSVYSISVPPPEHPRPTPATAAKKLPRAAHTRYVNAVRKLVSGAHLLGEADDGDAYVLSPHAAPTPSDDPPSRSRKRNRDAGVEVLLALVLEALTDLCRYPRCAPSGHCTLHINLHVCARV